MRRARRGDGEGLLEREEVVGRGEGGRREVAEMRVVGVVVAEGREEVGEAELIASVAAAVKVVVEGGRTMSERGVEVFEGEGAGVVELLREVMNPVDTSGVGDGIDAGGVVLASVKEGGAEVERVEDVAGGRLLESVLEVEVATGGAAELEELAEAGGESVPPSFPTNAPTPSPTPSNTAPRNPATSPKGMACARGQRQVEGRVALD